MEFVRNAWYGAAWSEDVGRTLLARTYLNEPVVLFRKEDGTPCALRDRCPHRFAPLSIGHLLGDSIECRYHGLRFDDCGRCIDNPNGNGVIPSAARVQTYPLTEQWGLIWIWLGNPNLADHTLVPKFPWLSTPDRYASVHGTIHLKANYLLVQDNLTDLTHASFVHSSTLEPREMARNAFKITEENQEVWTRVFIPSMEVPKFFTLTKGLTGRMDHWLEMRCNAPGSMITFYGVTPPGKPREEGWGTYNPNIITPETDTTTHYFWGSTRDYDIADEEMNKRTQEGAAYAFEHEDRPVLEAQQLALGSTDLMALRPVLLANDAASSRARRIIERQILAEKAALQVPTESA